MNVLPSEPARCIIARRGGNVKEAAAWGVSYPPTFKPKAVNGKRLVAANHQAKIFYNVVVYVQQCEEIRCEGEKVF